MSDKPIKNIHSGHRERLINTVYKCGIENVSTVQALEFILFYVFPRGDVNPIAHRLIERYKNIATVLEAPIEDLKTIKGMGETSAKKLHMMIDIFHFYTTTKLSSTKQLSTMGEIFDYLEALLRFKTEEEMYLFGINASGKVISQRCLAKGTINLVGIDMKDISLFVATYKVPAVLLVHNHPGGSSSPSVQDNISFERLSGVFTFSGCKLVDSLIVGNNGIYSMKDSMLKRIFIDSGNYYNKMIGKIDGKNK